MAFASMTTVLLAKNQIKLLKATDHRPIIIKVSLANIHASSIPTNTKEFINEIYQRLTSLARFTFLNSQTMFLARDLLKIKTEI
jgi:hypothetical protein